MKFLGKASVVTKGTLKVGPRFDRIDPVTGEPLFYAQ